jgi:stringent starvation protein B
VTDSGAPPANLPSRRPYLLRAMHEWMGDAMFTPHLIVDANVPGVEVPQAFVKDGRIVLNASLDATQGLQLANDWIEFNARFSGVVHHVRIPVSAVLGIYARETGEGMVFNENEPGAPPPPATAPSATGAARPAAGAKGKRARLTVVK